MSNVWNWKPTFFPTSIIQTQHRLRPQSICLIVQLVHRWTPGNVSPTLRLNLLDSLVELPFGLATCAHYGGEFHEELFFVSVDNGDSTPDVSNTAGLTLPILFVFRSSPILI